ncbi:MAG: MFS transporter [Alphaproteobacteria bacterium]
MKKFWQAVTTDRRIALAVMVAALGYFVDVFDLILFAILRVPSLKAIGVSGDALMSEGMYLLNMQMGGMLAGGLLWGILGDKLGRIKVLFGSILLYSIGNIGNAFVADIPQYALCRFITGVGLAGEVGAAITLVTEMMPKETRGYGTMVIVVMGSLGAVVAGLIGDMMSWTNAYIVGGVMGLALLAMRVSLCESGIFRAACAHKDLRHGDVMMILTSPARLMRYIYCILVGVPLWFVIGVLIAFAPEIGTALGMQEVPKTIYATMIYYGSLTFGTLFCGMISQNLGSRKRAIALFIAMGLVFSLAVLLLPLSSANLYYALCVPLGFCGGFWVVFLTMVAEQFGANLRATATTSAPNFVRGSIVPITLAFGAMKESLGVLNSAAILAVAVFGLSLLALARLRESFHNDMDYVEIKGGAMTLAELEESAAVPEGAPG